jgi:hypothetical protein
MKNLPLIILLFLFNACNSGGGKGGGQTITEIVDEISNESQLTEITDILGSEDHEASIRQFPIFAAHIDIQKTHVFDIDNEAISYLFVNERSEGRLSPKGFNIIAVDVQNNSTKKYSNSSIDEYLGRIRKVYHHNNLPIVLTQRPINLVSVNPANNEVVKLTSILENGLIKTDQTVLSHKSLNLKGFAKREQQICGLVKSSGLAAFSFDLSNSTLVQTLTEASWTTPGVISSNLLCADNGIYILNINDDLKEVYHYNFSTSVITSIFSHSEVNSKIYLFSRQGQNYLRLKLPISDSRVKVQYIYHELTDSTYVQTSSILAATINPYRYLRTYLSRATSDLISPHVDLLVHDLKSTILQSDNLIRIENLTSYTPLIYRLRKANGELYAITQGSVIYKLDSNLDNFIKVGSPLGLNVTGIKSFNDKIYMIAAGNRLLEWDPTANWSYDTIDYIREHRYNSTHNPKFLKQFSGQNFRALSKVSVINNELSFNALLKDKEGSLLFSYDLVNDQIINQYKSPANFNLADELNLGLEVLIGASFNKPSNIFDSQDGASLTWLNSDFSFKESFRPIEGIKNIRNMIPISGKLIFIAENKLYAHDNLLNDTSLLITYRGLQHRRVIKTKNNKLLTINDGQVLLIDPIKAEIKILFNLENISRVKSVSLIKDKFFIIDKFSKLHELHLSLADLRLFDAQE